MNMVFLLKSIWVFILGVAVALIGIFTLITRPDMGTNPFIIMLMGLFFTGAGSIYGKKKLRDGEPAVSRPPEQRDLGYQPQYRDVPEPPYQGYPQREIPVQQTSQQMEMRAEHRETPREEFLEIAEEAAESEKVAPSARELVKPSPQEPAVKPTVEVGERHEIPEKHIVKPKAGAIIKIVVCPKCGTENEVKDKFCYSCGFKIKPDKKRARKPKKAEIPKKPVKPTVKKTTTKKPAKKISPKTTVTPVSIQTT